MSNDSSGIFRYLLGFTVFRLAPNLEQGDIATFLPAVKMTTNPTLRRDDRRQITSKTLSHSEFR